MNRYDLLRAAYIQRDNYAMMLFGFAAFILLTDWATAKMPKLQKATRIFLLIAFVGLCIYGLVQR